MEFSFARSCVWNTGDETPSAREAGVESTRRNRRVGAIVQGAATARTDCGDGRDRRVIRACMPMRQSRIVFDPAPAFAGTTLMR
jgi:hypothetical protein